MSIRIPFNKPFFAGKELQYIKECVDGGHTSGDGVFTRRCQTLLEQIMGAKRVMLTHSGTAALEMGALLANLAPGDEVILPSFTFVSTANAFYLRGAKLVFVDVRPDTFNIDETLLEAAITERTKVIVPVHYAGVACEMDTIMDIAQKHGLMVIEDAAQALGATYKGRALGTIGDIGAISFHETKNYICGEGGGIVINRDALIKRSEIIREKGTNRSRFLRGEVDKYTWVDVGSSYLPSDIVAAFLCAQLEQVASINARRKDIYNRYLEGLKPLQERGLLRLPAQVADCNINYHSFHLLMKDEQSMDSLMKHLRQNGVLAVFHYQPLHLSEMGLAMGYGEGDFPVTEDISSKLLRLPFYYELSHSEQDEVIELISSFLLRNIS
jgi:dTDP-4-amino-4,6-dideoxygalactose transaminase